MRTDLRSRAAVAFLQEHGVQHEDGEIWLVVEEKEHEGLSYIRVFDRLGDSVTVYRVTNRGLLRRMLRPPKALLPS